MNTARTLFLLLSVTLLTGCLMVLGEGTTDPARKSLVGRRFATRPQAGRVLASAVSSRRVS